MPSPASLRTTGSISFIQTAPVPSPFPLAESSPLEVRVGATAEPPPGAGIVLPGRLRVLTPPHQAAPAMPPPFNLPPPIPPLPMPVPAPARLLTPLPDWVDLSVSQKGFLTRRVDVPVGALLVAAMACLGAGAAGGVLMSESPAAPPPAIALPAAQPPVAGRVVTPPPPAPAGVEETAVAAPAESPAPEAEAVAQPAGKRRPLAKVRKAIARTRSGRPGAEVAARAATPADVAKEPAAVAKRPVKIANGMPTPMPESEKPPAARPQDTSKTWGSDPFAD